MKRMITMVSVFALAVMGINLHAAVPVGPGPVVPVAQQIRRNVAEFARRSNVLIPALSQAIAFRSRDYGQCYFFPTGRNDGFVGCKRDRGAFYAWRAKAQCQASVTPLSTQTNRLGQKTYMHLGSYANPGFMRGVRRAVGGQSRRCNVYGKIQRRALGWGPLVR